MAAHAQPPEFLARIVRAKRAELESAKLRVPQKELEKRVTARPPGRFLQALVPAPEGQRSCAIIAELKKASPSAGVLRENYDPSGIARRYREAGARALSVLTDREFFQGSLDDLKQAKAASTLPALRKDFTLEEYHLYEAAAAGADAVLLIVAILQPQVLRRLLSMSGTLGLDALVEVHTAEELAVALEAGSEIIGVNNRNLHTFEVSTETSFALIGDIPDETVAVSESGLRSAEDLERLRSAGFDAFLIGESFMRNEDPGEALQRLLADVAARAPMI